MKRFLYQLFVQDMFRKIIALVLAILLFELIQKELSVVEEISDVPIEIQTAPTLLVSANKSHSAKIRVKAPTERSKSLRPSNFSCIVKVEEEDCVNGKCIIPVSPKNFTAPKDVSVESVIMVDKSQSHTLPLTVYRKKTIEVEPVAEFSGKLPEGFGYTAVLTPKVILASGIDRSLEDIKIKTKPIPLNESIRESFDYDVQLDPPVGVNVEPETVRATVIVEPKTHSRVMENVPLFVLRENTAADRRIFLKPATVSIRLNGSSSLLAECRREDLRAYVDLTGLKPSGIIRLEPQCWVKKPGVTVFSIDPAEIQVVIK